MRSHILVTGGAGFIGSHLTDALIASGYQVRILDNLESQVHEKKSPAYLNKHAEFIFGDVGDSTVVTKALQGIDIVYHLASRVGVGQSNYQIKEYVDVNIGGMANILQSIVTQKSPVKKIIMTASMTSYGEGNYRCTTCGIVKPALRDLSHLRQHHWDPYCPTCNKRISPVATSENALINNNSIYALTKNAQEAMLLLFGTLYKVPIVSLRCFNVYGPRQSLSNPYTGVSAIFISRLKNNKQPVVYEDGKQTRDFISVHDVVRAAMASMTHDAANGQVINIGSGRPTSVLEMATILATLLAKEIHPSVTGKYRINDIRHCIADIRKAKKLLNWTPQVSLPDGLNELIEWSKGEKARDSFENAQQKLRNQKLL